MRKSKFPQIFVAINCLMLMLFMVGFKSVKTSGAIISGNHLYFNNNKNINKKALIPDDSYDVSKSLPENYVKDGSEDYTSFVQRAISMHDHILFPAFPILINDDGLLIGSNKVISFLPGAELWLKPSIKKGYNILKIDAANNTIINNPNIKGDRSSHLGSIGEWGQGIGIYSSSNITINNPQVSDCWGDGIYLADAKGSIMPDKGITINNAVLKHNRRDGISIISVDGLVLSSPYAGYCDGTLPMCGINFEPNTPDDELKNIVVTNPRTEFNGGDGISIGLRSLYGKYDKQIEIKITNAQDLKSKIGFKATASLKRRLGNETINGEISIIDPQWVQNEVSPIQTNLLDRNIKLTIENPVVIGADGKKLDRTSTISLLTYKTHINKDANFALTFH